MIGHIRSALPFLNPAASPQNHPPPMQRADLFLPRRPGLDSPDAASFLQETRSFSPSLRTPGASSRVRRAFAPLWFRNS